MIKCGNCHERHASVSDVRECYGVQTMRRPAEMAGTTEGVKERRSFRTMREMTADQLRRSRPTAKATTRTDAKITEDGIYRNPFTDEIFKVQKNRGDGDGRRLYAKRMILGRHTEDGGYEEITKIPFVGYGNKGSEWSARFVYAPGAMRNLRPEWRMTLEDAKKFGALYGTCVRCGRTLTKEESIERSLGSTCVKYFS